ncbi:hypothetical protein [uncultured Flavobacterium sp.]|uniref:hypothetical protein n=1 Tax=uncultured Flavobacterium sp. TaxID=165435 RepID=UPI0030EF6240|tara:strand:+ start:31146 stop:31658 length:513 start_codon:yes stop_codon:yes gene_type:complete
MKKSILLLIGVLTLVSCGKDKKENQELTEPKESLKTTLILDAIYIKDDSLAVFCKVDNYFLYDKPITVKVKGSDVIQRISIEIPENTPVESFSIVASTNKDQSTLVMKGISVEQNNKMVFDGSDYKYLGYFLADESFVWDEAKQRCDISHSNKYPPGIVGSEKIEQILIK